MVVLSQTAKELRLAKKRGINHLALISRQERRSSSASSLKMSTELSRNSSSYSSLYERVHYSSVSVSLGPCIFLCSSITVSSLCRNISRFIRNPFNG